MPKNLHQKCANVFWTCFGVTYQENFFCPVFHGGSSLRKVFKKSKYFQNTKKTPKPFPKMSKRLLNMFWGYFFENFFLPSVPWRVESSKCSQKIKKISNFQECPKSFPKVSKHVLNKFWGNFSEKFFCPVLHGGSSLRNVFKNRKSFKIPKMPKNVPQKCENVFWTCFGVTYQENFFRPVFDGRSSFRNVFKKSKKFQIFKNAQNRSQKCPNMFWTSFGVIFPKSFFAQCCMEGRVFEMFSKIEKVSKFQKCPKMFPKSAKTCFEHVLG